MVNGDSLHHKAISDALQGVLANGQHNMVTSSTVTTTTMTKSINPEIEMHHSTVDLGSGMSSTERITEVEDVPNIESIDGDSGTGAMVLHHSAMQSMDPSQAMAHVMPGQLQIREQRHQNAMHTMNGGAQQNVIGAGSNTGMLQTSTTQTTESGIVTEGNSKGRRGCKKGCRSAINTAEVLSASVEHGTVGGGPMEIHGGDGQMSLTTTEHNSFHINEATTDRFGNTIVDNAAANTKQLSKRERRAAARQAKAQANGQMSMPMHPPWGPPHAHPMGPPPHLQQQIHFATQQQQQNMMHSHGGGQGQMETTTINTMTQSGGGSTGGCKTKRCRGKNNSATSSGATQGAIGGQQNIQVDTEYKVKGERIRHSMRKG